MAPDPGSTKRRILLAVQVITVSTQLLELAVLVFAPDVKTFGPPTRDLHDLGRQFRSSYDFIIVGGSPSSAAIASRLSELQQWSVLLLEAAEDEEASSYQSYMQDSVCSGRDVNNVYLRGSKQEYDAWGRSGNIGWDYDSVLPYFRKTEDMRVPKYANSEHYGNGGYLTLEEYRSYSVVSDIILDAGKELGYGERTDSNLGFSKLYGASRNGLWCSASRAFLRPARHRKNLDISYNSRVERILIDPNTTRAVGVVFRKHGQQYVILTDREVILSAGPIRSPHLLLLSGVGPEENLRQSGIYPVISDLPVGCNLLDHIGLHGPLFTLNRPISSVYSIISFAKATLQNLFYSADSFTTQNLWEIVAFSNSEPSGLPDTAVYISGNAAEYGIMDAFSMQKDTFSTFGILLRPRTAGVLKLRSKDPNISPEIHKHYLNDQDDVRTLLESVKLGLNLSKSSIMQSYRAEVDSSSPRPCDRLPLTSEEYFRCVVEHRVVGMGHYAGTCKMGPDSDPEAVVDARLRVRGVGGLRVADSSVMPTLVSTDLSATSIMIGEKAADIIKEDWLTTFALGQEYC